MYHGIVMAFHRYTMYTELLSLLQKLEMEELLHQSFLLTHLSGSLKEIHNSHDGKQKFTTLMYMFSPYRHKNQLIGPYLNVFNFLHRMGFQ